MSRWVHLGWLSLLLLIPAIAQSSSPKYDIQVQAVQYGWTPQLHHQMGDQLAASGDWIGAVAHWENANLQTADDLAKLINGYFILQRWDDSIALLRQILTLEPENKWARFNLGQLIAPTNPLEAETHLIEAQRSNTYTDQSTDLLNILRENFTPLRVGLWFSQDERWDLAEYAFRQAALMGDEVAPAYVALAREQQNKSGADWMAYALEIAPQNAHVYYVYGLYLRRQGEMETSVSALEAAVTFDPLNPAYYAELGTAYRLIGSYFNAEGMLRLAVDYSGNDPMFEEMLAVFYAEEGYQLTDDRLADLQQSQANLPPDPTLHASLGWALHNMGDSQSALIEVDAALALEPDYPLALYYKAQILIETDNLEAALPIAARLAEGNSEFATWASEIIAQSE